MHAQAEGVSFEEILRRAGEGTPLRQLTPLAQVADAAVLAASDLAASMTATVLNTTGGAQVD